MTLTACTIVCNLCRAFGAELQARSGSQVNQLRRALQEAGWVTSNIGRDYCPKCCRKIGTHLSDYKTYTKKGELRG